MNITITKTLKTCNDCDYKEHTGAFTKGGSKPCCNHPETCKKKGYNCFKRIIPYKTEYSDQHKNIRTVKTIPKWCPFRNFGV